MILQPCGEGITGGATVGDKPAGYAPNGLLEGSFPGFPDAAFMGQVAYAAWRIR